MTERWRDIEGGLYAVSDHGRVRNARGRLLTPSCSESDRSGYLKVSLSAAGRHRFVTVHSLVAKAFIGPRPVGHHVCHFDGDRRNNAATNLRYDTPKGNAADKRRHGKHYCGEQNHNTLLTEAQVVEALSLRGKVPGPRVAAQYGVHPQTIYSIWRGDNWKHIPRTGLKP